MMLGRPVVAATSAAESLQIRLENSCNPMAATQPWAIMAMAAAERGDVATAADLAGRIEELCLPTGREILSLVKLIRGRIALSERRFADAYAELRKLFDPAEPPYCPNNRPWAIADLADAAYHSGGDRSEAASFLADIEVIAASVATSYLRAQTSYARALLDPGDRTGDLLATALAGELQTWPALRARGLLTRGVWLRRQRRIGEARLALRDAETLASGLGYMPLADRAG